MPGAAPDGSNPFQTNNGGAAVESTMSTANSGDEEMVDTKVDVVSIS